MKIKNIKETHPHLVKDWDYKKNKGIKPEDVSKGSHKRVWWLCHKCGYSWESFVFNRTRTNRPCLCPACAKKIPTLKNSIVSTHKYLLEEWNYKKNGKIKPESITFGSTKKIWWKCTICDHEWKVSTNQRTYKKSGCPACAGQVVSLKNNLEYLYPEIAKEWDYKKNKKLIPTNITSGSNKKVWWLCSTCRHSWKTAIYDRTAGKGCPACAGQVATENNNLTVTHPDLMKEWCYKKNKRVDPRKLTYGSSRKVWWTCFKCDHIWKTAIYTRTSGHGCPQCSSSSISMLSQKWLDSLNIKTIKREHTLNIENNVYIVDGYDPETNTIYEFFGDYWHGNPDVYSPKDLNPTTKKSYKCLHQKTMKRIDIFKKYNYNVIFIWENDYLDK